ncbi:MAG: glycoside hydrolase family 3 protein [Faecousia sp.]
MKRIIRATTDAQISEREKQHMALARQIYANGIVLLENNGVLPLRNSNIALYGFGARHTGFGGTGSGENRPRQRINIEQGLENAGLTVTTKAWLDDFDREYDKENAAWRAALTEGLKKCPKLDQMDYASAHPFRPPFGRAITREDIQASGTDTALYILTRQAGEGADRQTAKGDYYIRNEELEHLKVLSSEYDRVILVINTGGIIDLGFLDEVPVSAVVYALQGGMEMGNGLTDVLTGKVTPSGKLSDTWAMRYEDYPCHDTFSYRSGNSHIEEYREGIYVGYRWFDAQRIAPRYPFGYGLSYTDFSITPGEITVQGSRVTVQVEVCNTGAAYSGREVVQLYISAPAGKLHKEVQSLAAFAKTPVLKPGKKTNVVLSFDLADWASFDEQAHQWILEAGSYHLRVGNSSGNLVTAAILDLSRPVITEQNEAVCPLQHPLEMLAIPARKGEMPEVPHYSVDAGAFQTGTHVYHVPEMRHDPALDSIMEKLSLKDMTNLLVGTSYFGAVHNTVFGAGGTTTSALLKKGITNMPMSDGPQGLNLLPKSLKPWQNIFTMPALPETLQYGKVNFFAQLTQAKENDKRTVYYQYCTAWPCETIVAQTWDLELARLQGEAVGREMKEFGVVYWLAPAMNIHRNPLCGRNYEYYSEDPFLTGKMAAAATLGVQSVPGCYVTLKHFACNNLECDRNQSDSRLDERTLREIYLKGFRIAVEEGGVKGIMASYNMVNGVYLPNNYDLLTKVLRNEWGFDGIVMTDWFATGHHESKDELGCKAGNDLLMPGTPQIPGKLRQALKDGVISPEDVERAARNIVWAAMHCCVAE